MARVQLVDVSKRYGQTLAVDGVSADIAEGEFITLLGPSGCGKTTTLRMVAGLIEPSTGEIRFDDQVVNRIPTHKRNIGLAFQSHALFPHLSVAKNIAFGLSVKGMEKRAAEARVAEMLEMMELTGFGDRMPAHLSGGQQQRVALARMLATDPRVLLFDEPLSALDRNLRDTLKYSILELQRRTKKTAIYVTHDQSEAFAISDRIFVMNKGRIEQGGTQLDIYLRPASEFVATFVGDNNAVPAVVVKGERGEEVKGNDEVIRGTVRVRMLGVEVEAFAGFPVRAGEEVLAFVRPENIQVLKEDQDREQAGVVAGTVDQIVFEGASVRLVVDVGGTAIRVESGGLERLTLLGTRAAVVYLRLAEVSLVRSGEAAVVA